MNALKQELDKFMEGARSNPPEGALYEFLQDLSTDGKLFEYDLKDWVEAGRSYGLDDDEIARWIDTAASWLDDTTEEGQYDPEPAFWAQEPGARQNPEEEECLCEESCNCDPCPCDPCEACKYCLCCCVCEEDEDEEESFEEE